MLSSSGSLDQYRSSNIFLQILKIILKVNFLQINEFFRRDGIGKEVVSKFTTNFKTDGAFYTDSNGRQLLKRVRNQRPTWDLELEEPISGKS